MFWRLALEICVGSIRRLSFDAGIDGTEPLAVPRYLPPVEILLFKVSRLRGYLLRVPPRNKPLTRHSHKQRRLSTRQSFETQVESSITMFSVESNGYT